MDRCGQVAAPGLKDCGGGEGGGRGQIELRRCEKHPGGVGYAPQEILRSEVSEIPPRAFWGLILHNSEDYKTSYKIHKRQHI